VSVDGLTAAADGNTNWMVWNWAGEWPWDNASFVRHSNRDGDWESMFKDIDGALNLNLVKAASYDLPTPAA